MYKSSVDSGIGLKELWVRTRIIWMQGSISLYLLYY